MSHKLVDKNQIKNDSVIIFPDPMSLGYSVQGVSILDAFMSATDAKLIIQADKRLVSLYERSYVDNFNERIIVVPKISGPSLPNGGKPQTSEQMAEYFSENASLIAEELGCKDYLWSTLLRPEISSPFNAHCPPLEFIRNPEPRYLLAEQDDIDEWQHTFDPESQIVLINWNKAFSQHGDAAQQNLDADDIAFIIQKISERSDIRIDFFNAVHAVSEPDLRLVNDRLPEGISLKNIIDPRTGQDFNLGSELDRYVAFMSACKDDGGVMIGVGNTCQHMWYAAMQDYICSVPNQVVVLPHGDFPTKPTWELQAAQPYSPTVTISKSEDFADNRTLTLRRIADATLSSIGMY